MARWSPFALTDAHVRHHEDGLLVVHKPSGLAVHATVDPQRPHLLGAVQAYASARGIEAVALHHRLDVDTSGLVLFTTNPALNGPIGALFASHRIDKRYVAIVRPQTGTPPPPAWTVENFLGRDKASKSTRYVAVRSGGKKAITHFEVQARHGARIRLEARPVTGRAHQIRVHCAQKGWPIEGDRYYEGARAPRLMLHAAQLRFEHPQTGAPIEIEDAPPSDFDVG